MGSKITQEVDTRVADIPGVEVRAPTSDEVSAGLSPRALYFWRLRLALVILSTLALGIGLLLLGRDFQLSQNLRAHGLPGDLRKAVMLSEAFAHGSGAAAICIALALAARERAAVWAVVAMTASSGIVANLLKALMTRSRPYTYEVAHSEMVELSGWEFLNVKGWWDASERSFPSGHTATAWGLAIGLSCAYPRATPVFVLLAILATYQRLISGAHFISDVSVGFAVACGCCAVVLSFARVQASLPLGIETTEPPEAP